MDIPFFVSLLLSIATMGTCVRIIEPPQDQVVHVGDSATFTCGYRESLETPHWVINGELFATQSLPSSRYSYQNERLTLSDVQNSDNGSTFQCIFLETSSSVATLTVIHARTDGPESTTQYIQQQTTTLVENEPATVMISTVIFDATTTTTDESITAANKETTYSSTDGTAMSVRRSTKLEIAVSVCGSAVITFLIICITILVAIMIRKKHHKQEKVLEPADIEGVYEEIMNMRETSLGNSPETQTTPNKPHEDVKSSIQTLPPLPSITLQCTMVENPSYSAPPHTFS